MSILAAFLIIAAPGCGNPAASKTRQYVEGVRRLGAVRHDFVDWKDFHMYTEALILLASDSRGDVKEFATKNLIDVYENLSISGNIRVGTSSPRSDADIFVDTKAYLLQKIYDPSAVDMTVGVYLYGLRPQMDLFSKLRPQGVDSQDDPWYAAAKELGVSP
ncbi:MAG: hypothetical protein SFY96_10680 [Planctomycetota bacterium]|nr:hypothetical protein [Planctomycetota bacterium]